MEEDRQRRWVRERGRDGVEKEVKGKEWEGTVGKEGQT